MRKSRCSLVFRRSTGQPLREIWWMWPTKRMKTEKGPSSPPQYNSPVSPASSEVLEKRSLASIDLQPSAFFPLSRILPHSPRLFLSQLIIFFCDSIKRPWRKINNECLYKVRKILPHYCTTVKYDWKKINFFPPSLALG